MLGPIFYANMLPQCPLVNICYLVRAQHTKVSTNFGEAQDERALRMDCGFEKLFIKLYLGTAGFHTIHF